MTELPNSPPAISVTEAIQIALRFQVPWVVMLHNGQGNETNYVVDALCKAVDCLSTQDATDISTEAKMKGVAVVGKWRLELAEFYQERIKTFGLMATIERG